MLDIYINLYVVYMQRNILYRELRINSYSYTSSHILFFRSVIKSQNEINIKIAILFTIFKTLVREFKRTVIFFFHPRY